MTAASPGVALSDRPQRLRQLDGLRAVAIGLVVAHHLWPMPLWMPRLGHVGVSLFFVLSGFLITRILLEARGRIEVGGATWRELGVFYARRAIRIFPPYYALLGIVWLLDVRRIDERIGWHALYLSNWLFTDPAVWRQGGFDRHLWSLSVEEQFYLAWPWLMLLAPRRMLPAVFAMAFVGAPLWRAWFWLRGWPGGWVEFPTFAHADLLAAGGLMAYLWHWRHVRRLAWVLLALGIPASAVVLGMHRSDYAIDARITFNQTGLSMLFAAFTYFAATGIRGPVGRVLDWGPMVGIGVISYAMYLVHTFCGGLAWHWLGDDSSELLVGFVATGLTLAIATASWFCFEGPINRLKRFFPYRRP